MKNILPTLLVVLMFSNQLVYADKTSDINSDKQSLTVLLNEFLAGQTFEHHNDFWAEDLIYTSSSGTRFDKKFIMDGMNPEDSMTSEDNDKDSEDSMTFSAEEIDIRIYDKTAIVAFKLVGREKKAGATDHVYYFNTGTFLKRNNKWQAIAWQATKIPTK